MKFSNGSRIEFVGETNPTPLKGLASFAVEGQMNAFPVLEKPEPIKVYRLTRRQVRVWKLLDQGYVLELLRPRGRRASRMYALRAPQSLEADGELVQSRTVEPLVSQGWAIRVRLPWNYVTWVYSSKLYQESALAKLNASSTANPTQPCPSHPNSPDEPE